MKDGWMEGQDNLEKWESKRWTGGFKFFSKTVKKTLTGDAQNGNILNTLTDFKYC